jgi:hypothetical protein
MAICIHYHRISYSLLLSIDVVVVDFVAADIAVVGCCSKIVSVAAVAVAGSLVASIAVVPKLEVEVEE